MNARYRLQLPPDGEWTEWRDIKVPIKEPDILAFEVKETLTREQWEKFVKHSEVSK